MTEWIVGNETQQRSAADDLGGTMRLGVMNAALRLDRSSANLWAGRDP